MRMRTVVEAYRPGDVFSLYPIGDAHYGSANCDVGHLQRTIDEVAGNPRARWIGMGDFVESISPRDKRWKAGGMTKEVVDNQDRIGDFYVERMSELLAPIADKLWSYGKGNHEETFDTNYYTDLSARILDRLGRSECYGEWSGITRVQFVDGTHRSALRVFHAHGWQSGRMDGAKVNQLDYLMGYIDDCDIYLQGHSHSVLIKSKVKLRANHNFDDVEAVTCYGAHTGSFLKTYAYNTAGYSERAQYPPTKLGTVRFDIRPNQRGMKVEAVQ